MIGKRISDWLRNPRKLAHRESEAAGRMVRRPDRQRSPPPDQELVADIDWPPRAVTMRVLDLDGREVHSKVKGDTRS